jgi:hypothetical protein
MSSTIYNIFVFFNLYNTSKEHRDKYRCMKIIPLMLKGLQ